MIDVSTDHIIKVPPITVKCVAIHDGWTGEPKDYIIRKVNLCFTKSPSVDLICKLGASFTAINYIPGDVDMVKVFVDMPDDYLFSEEPSYVWDELDLHLASANSKDDWSPAVTFYPRFRPEWTELDKAENLARDYQTDVIIAEREIGKKIEGQIRNIYLAD